MKLCMTLFALSVHCYSELPSCLRPLSFRCCLLCWTVYFALFPQDLFAISWSDTCGLTFACPYTSKAHVFFVLKSVSLDFNTPDPWCLCANHFPHHFFRVVYTTSQSICRASSTYPVSSVLALNVTVAFNFQNPVVMFRHFIRLE